MEPRICPNCGRDCDIWMYCSDQCMNEYREYLISNGGGPKKCLRCGEALPPHRADNGYCTDSSSCRSIAHQSGPRDYRKTDDTSTLIHAALERNNTEYCQAPDCGKPFNFNAYADRSGKRQPLYCSRACKQRAYRERKKRENA